MQPRPDALAPFHHHGGDLAQARLRFPDAPEPWLDLSTGINPVSYPLPALPPDAWTRLPDPAALAALESVAGAAYGAQLGDALVAAPGTQALIQRLPGLRPARRVAVLGPTYGEHAAVWHASGASVQETADLRALADAEVAVVVNPNNPDGRIVTPTALAGLAAHLSSRGGLLVVDEAFMDVAAPGASLVPDGIPAGAVVLRSLGKAFGLAGLRLGFLLGAPAMVDAMRRALGPWPVSGPAIAIGRAALADRDWLEAACRDLAGMAARLDAALEQAGLKVVGGTALFRLAAHRDAAPLFMRLAKRGILVRPFADPTLLRFGVPGNAAALARLSAALAGWAAAQVEP